MQLIANEKSIPRIHLIGTLLIVLLLTVGLSGYNLWQNRQEAQSSFDRIEQALNEQIKARLKAEMHNAIIAIDVIRSQTEAVLRENIMQQVDTAYQIAEAIHTQESSLQPAAEVQKMIVETLRPVRFYDNRGYFFIDDMNGQFILLPTSPELEGKFLLDNRDDTGHFIMRGLIAAAKLPRSEGFSRYRWYTPENPTVMADKLSYVRYFEPYDWLIGTGDYLYKWEERQKKEALLHLRNHRFGITGYAALFDAGGRLLISPSDTALEGKTATDLSAFERSVIEKLLATARAGGGIVHYDWPKADAGELVKKTAYVQIYEPWQWVVIITMFDDEIHVALAAEQQAHMKLSARQAVTIALAGLAALLLGLAASWTFSRWMRQLFERYHQNNLSQQDTLRQQADALHKTQASLRESENHFRTLANNGLALIWTSGPDKLCNYFNETWLRYTGHTLEQELGNGWTEGVHPEDFDRCLHIYVSHFDRREPFSMEYRLRKSDGEYGWILDLGNPRYDSEGNFEGYIGYCYDITERKRTEEDKKILNAQLQQAQKLEAIGTLAGGIAHDFNNILSAILGYTEMAKEDSEPGSKIIKNLDRVMEAGHRASSLVKQILAFSRQNTTDPVPLNSEPIVKEAIKLLRPGIPSTIAIAQHFTSPIHAITADPTQIHQVVMNLCTNAFHAMETTGGTLGIRLENKKLTSHDIQQYPNVTPGEFVVFSVSDTGSGIPLEIRDRIFDPFFTTKEVGKGTGMGLAIVHGIAATLNGFVTCESVPGSGSVFRVFLPAIQTDVITPTLTASDDAIPTGREHVLYVDDERILAELGKTMLERLGYDVTLCTDSTAALSFFREHPTRFDVLITDQTMPGMTGFELSRNILQIRPDFPIILCTGFSNLVDEEEAKQAGIKGFIMKPLTKKGLAELLAKVKNKNFS